MPLGRDVQRLPVRGILRGLSINAEYVPLLLVESDDFVPLVRVDSMRDIPVAADVEQLARMTIGAN